MLGHALSVVVLGVLIYGLRYASQQLKGGIHQLRIETKNLRIAYKQLETIQKNSDIDLISSLRKEYSSKKMGKAVWAIHNKPIEKFKDGGKLDMRRRLVSHFWLNVAIMVDEKVRLDLLEKYFLDRFDDWEVLRPLEQKKLVHMALRDLEKDGVEITDDVIRRVEMKADEQLKNEPLEKLYNSWGSTPKLKI